MPALKCCCKSWNNASQALSTMVSIQLKLFIVVNIIIIISVSWNSLSFKNAAQEKIALTFLKPLYWGMIDIKKLYIFDVYNLVSLEISLPWNHCHNLHYKPFHHL